MQVVCHKHEDVSRMLLNAEVGECQVGYSKKEQLVADTANKLAGIEHYFGEKCNGGAPKVLTTHRCNAETATVMCVRGEGRRVKTHHMVL